MRFAVLCAADSWYLDDLRRAAGDRRSICPVSFRDLSAAVGFAGTPHVFGSDTDGNGTEHLQAGAANLGEFDAIIVRTMPPASLEQVVFRMDLLARCEAAGILVVNPAKAIECAVDKYLTTAKLHAAGILVPRTMVCQTVSDALDGFQMLGGDVVLKPLFGGEGRGITRLNDEALAHRAFSMLVSLGSVIYLQEFIDHPGYDIRVLLIGRQSWVLRRRNPLDWRTNLSRGAVAEPMETTPELIDLARRAATVVGAPVAGVDLLTDAAGRLYTIEVNAVPGWRSTAAALGVDIAARLLEYVVAEVAARRAREPK